jgi:predicted ATPase/DNA-binding SARP family transcriptional activator/DNA-binding CsgD family transcriptional regulator
MDLLWPDSGRGAASNSLRKALHIARGALDQAEGSRYLASEEESLVLGPGGNVWVDTEAFEDAAATARRTHDPAAYQAALDLYSGELLPGDRYEGWAEEPRRRLQETYLSLVLGLARLYEERGNYEPAVEALRRVVAEEPTREEAYVGLMRLYALSGRKGEALALYGHLEEALQEALGTEPAASSRALREEITSGRVPPKEAYLSGFSPEESPSVGRHNLPAPRTTFVGREREILEIKRALAMTRLLTLTGAGGSGKTRLAIEISRDLVGTYPDGVWLVELAPLSERELVSQEVAGTLGVQEQSSQPLAQTLAETLHRKKMLLVLDNCEHLVNAVASLVDALLSSCPRLRVLATSREALDVAGEIRWTVPSLSVPASRSSLTAQELEGYASARLFLERASDRRPGFVATTENAGAVAEVCRRLDGVPLAIELAAARVGTLSVEEIYERLKDSLRLLTDGGRTTVPRQRTLRGALDWSYNLLPELERKGLRRLSVFAGGWTLEAAEAVAGSRGIEKDMVLDLLSGIVSKSLAVTEVDEQSGVRYRMLEPVRQYALEKLEGSGEAEVVRRRHAEFFLTLVEEVELDLLTPTPQLLESVDAEHENVRAVFSWAIEREEVELGLRLAGALRWFWFARGHLGEGRRWLKEVLRHGGQTAARVKALLAMSWLALQQGDIDESEAAAEEGLKLGTETKVKSNLLAELWHMLGSAVENRGDYERATELFEEALALSREAGDRWGVSFALNALGNVSSMQGDYERATELYEECLTRLKESGDVAHSAIILSNLGSNALERGDHEQATALSEKAAALFREQGHPKGLEWALDIQGWAALMREDYEKARTFLVKSLALCGELGDKRGTIDSLEGLASLAAALEDDARAARLWGAAETALQVIGTPPTPDNLTQPYLDAASSRLGEEAWEAAFAAGRAMNLEEAAEYAFPEQEFTTPMPQEPDQPRGYVQRSILTRREEEIAALVARGLTNRQIASELSISEHTAATHVRRILKKLGLQSRAQIDSWLTERRPPTADLN